MRVLALFCPFNSGTDWLVVGWFTLNVFMNKSSMCENLIFRLKNEVGTAPEEGAFHAEPSAALGK